MRHQFFILLISTVCYLSESYEIDNLIPIESCTTYQNNSCIYNCMKGEVMVQVKYPILGLGENYRFKLQHDIVEECRKYTFTLSNQPHLHYFKLTFYYALDRDNIGLIDVHYDVQITKSHKKQRVSLSSKKFLKVVKDRISHYECNGTISDVNTFDYGTFTKIYLSIIVYDTFYGLSNDRNHKDVVHCANEYNPPSSILPLGISPNNTGPINQKIIENTCFFNHYLKLQYSLTIFPNMENVC
ncbi:hypothetical protein A3Q56_03137 [Intoshia linei]|uniref:Uncharacterized protein n=1 Tax=Intoshia linei TaxID=1819745 RepID=A0A177B5X4_9BILA|nr:hypothetical protein A3Q56_03137 [Intoshia linei]